MATLTFKGKSAVWNYHLAVSYHTLEKDAKKSLKGKNDSENLIIHGDNLIALKSLLPKYQGKIKCIYIDPPYNTGNNGGWVYNDNVSSPIIQEWMGHTVGREGEDLVRHDKWLCMMTPRLKLLRELLADNGAIFVSIDDNEQHHLRDLMNEVFAEENFVANIIWEKKYAASNDAKYFSDNHDFIVVYAKNRNTDNGWVRNLLPRNEKQDSLYKYDSNDGRGLWRSDNLSVKTYSKEYDYPISNPITKKKYFPPKGRCWLTNKTTMQVWIEEGRVFFGKDGKGAPQLKRYLKEVQPGTVPLSIWHYEDVGHTDEARKELKALFSDEKAPFDNPKPTRLIERILQLSSDNNSLVLDSFAGSGTTAQAVLALNKEDGGDRKFILVEMEDYADSITAERVRRAIKKNGYEAGFTYHTLGPAIDAESLLLGKLPTYHQLAKYVFYLVTGKDHPDEKQIKEKESLAGKTDSAAVYLIYQPDMEALQTLAVTLDWAQKTHAKHKGKKIVYAPACYLDEEMLEEFNITFVGIPYNLFEPT